MPINQSKGVKPKLREHKLRCDVNWQGALKQKGIKQCLRVLDSEISEVFWTLLYILIYAIVWQDEDQWKKGICVIIIQITEASVLRNNAASQDRNILPSYSRVSRHSSRTYWHLKMKVVHSCKTSGSDYPVTQRHIPEEWNPQPCHCKNLKTHIKITLSKMWLFCYCILWLEYMKNLTVYSKNVILITLWTKTKCHMTGPYVLTISSTAVQ
jgi:hypothetical protein